MYLLLVQQRVRKHKKPGFGFLQHFWKSLIILSHLEKKNTGKCAATLDTLFLQQTFSSFSKSAIIKTQLFLLRIKTWRGPLLKNESRLTKLFATFCCLSFSFRRAVQTFLWPERFMSESAGYDLSNLSFIFPTVFQLSKNNLFRWILPGTGQVSVHSLPEY